MRQVTVLSLRWPYAIMATLMAVPMAGPMLLPIIFTVFAPGLPRLRGDDLWALYLIATPLFTLWACLVVVPIVRPRRLILTEQGVTLNTLWRRQHWKWDCVAGIWPLGGYKAQLEVNLADSKPKRIFLGSYWPGDSTGLAKIISEYRART
jgi:hypothetical protein